MMKIIEEKKVAKNIKFTKKKYIRDKPLEQHGKNRLERNECRFFEIDIYRVMAY